MVSRGLLLGLGICLGCTVANPDFTPGSMAGLAGKTGVVSGTGGAAGSSSAGGSSGGGAPVTPAAGGIAGAADAGERPVLLGYWPLAEAIGAARATDLSPGARHGMVSGTGVAFVDDGLGGRALSFPGGAAADVGVAIAAGPEIDALTGFTIAARFRPASQPVRGTHLSVFSRQLRQTDNEVFNITCNAGDVIVYIPGTGSQINFEARQAMAAVVGTWTHALATYDGQTLVLYIDGEMKTSMPFANRLQGTASSNPIYIGTNKNSAKSEPFHGLIKDVVLYDRPIDPAHIRQLAAGTSPLALR